MRIYFDNAATTPLSEGVIEAMTEAMKSVFGNPSSIHAEGRKARTVVEEARKQVANHLNASIGEIFFTSGGTESNNMALKCSVRDLGVQRIISSPTEHHCVLHSLEALKKQGVEVHLLQINTAGEIDLKALQEQLKGSAQKTLVSLMHANNEIGTLADVETVAELCREHGALFHTDTVQTIGYYPLDLSKTPISFMSGSAHKLHGPKGTGFIYISRDNIIKPFIDGGSQERNMRAGTENIPGIVGLAKAMDEAYAELAERKAIISGLKDYMKQQLKKNFEGVEFNGSQGENSHCKILSVSFPPSLKSDLLLVNLDIAGISASGGSACSSGAEASSYVLEAIQADPDRKTIRFSFSHYNTKEEVDFAVEKLRGIL